MKISSVVVTFTHEDDTDPVNAVDEILGYAINRGLYAEELGLTTSKLVISAPMPTVTTHEHDDDAWPEHYVPDWEVINL